MADKTLVDFYRGVLQEQKALDVLDVTSRLSQASTTNPDQMQRGRYAAQSLGVGAPLSQASAKELERRRNLHDWAARVKETPHLRAFLAKPGNALVAHDDVYALADLEFEVQSRAYGGTMHGVYAGTVPTSDAYSGPAQKMPASRRSSKKGMIERAIFGDDGLLDLATDNKYMQSAAASASQTIGASVSGFADTLHILAGLNDWMTRATSFPWSDTREWPRLQESVKPAVDAARSYGEGVKSDSRAVDVPQDQRDFGTDTAGAVGQIGAQIFASIINAPGAFASLFFQGVNSQKDQLIKEGVDVESPDAQAGMILTGMFTLVSESLGIKFVKKIPTATKNRWQAQLSQAAQSFGAEAVSEAAESVFQNMVTYAIADVEEGFLSYATEGALYSGAVGGTAGGGVNLFLNLLTPGRARVRIEQEAEQTKENLDALHAASEQSALKNRAPEQFAEFAKEVQGKDSDNVVYIPAEVFTEFYQSDERGPVDYAQAMGIATEYEQASATGHDVAVPLEQYLAHTNAEQHAAIADHVRTEADGRSVADNDNGVVQEDIDALRRHIDRVAPQSDPAEVAARQYRQAMTDAGMPKSQAGPTADMVGAMAATMADRAGMPVEQFIRDIGGVPTFRVGGKGAMTADALAQKERPEPTTITPPSEARLRSNETVNVAQVRENRFAQTETPFSEARKYGKENIAGKSFTNADTGWSISVSGNAINKTVRSAQGSPEHLEALQVLPELIKNSVLFDSREGRKGQGIGGDSITAVHRLAAAVTIGDKTYRAKLTVRRNDQKKVTDNNRFYELKLDEIELEVHKAAAPSSEDVGTDHATSSSTVDIVNLFTGVKRESDGKPVLTEQGAREFEQRHDAELRGSILLPPGGLTGGKTIINLFEGADQSTVLHELGHYFLEVLRASAQMPGATLELQQMWDDAKEQLGIKDDGRIPRDAHEKWAEAIEVYFGKGEAPSVELRGVFTRFQSWMTKLWAYLRRVHGAEVDQNIDPKIRELFDRMLATDEQISEARSLAETLSVFSDRETAGMSGDEWAAYQAQEQAVVDEGEARARKKVADEHRRRQEKDYREAMKMAREEAAATIAEQPVYQVMDELMAGPDDNGIDTRLDRQALIDMGYGDNLRAKKNKEAGNRLFPAGKRGLYSENGDHPDIVATLYGFETGREMLDAILDAPPRKVAIEAEAKRIVHDAFGDALTDGSIADAVFDGLHGDAKARLIATEMNWIYQMAPVRSSEPKEPTRLEVQELARQMMAEQTMKDALRVDRYLNAERRFAREAHRAVAKGDFVRAREAKLAQLVQFYLWKESKALRQSRGKTAQLIRRITRDEAKSGKSNDIDFLRAARFILSKYGMASSPKGYSFRDWFNDLEVNDPDTAETLGRAWAIATDDAKPWRTTKVSEYQTLMDAVDGVLHQGRARHRIRIAGEFLAIDEARNAVLEQVAKTIDPETTRVHGAGLTDKLLSFNASVRRAASWARSIDGGDTGPMQQFIIDPVLDATSEYRRVFEHEIKAIRDLLKPRLRDLYRSGVVDAPELGHTFDNKGQVFAALLNSGNESNLQALLDGYGWDAEQWAAFVGRAEREGILTREDYEAAQIIWDTFERLRPQAQRAHKEMYGHYFDRIPATRLETSFGNFRGGYMPLVYDKAASATGQRIDTQQILNPQDGSMMFPSTDKGFTKSRTGVVAPLDLSLTGIPAHVDKVLRFIHIQPAVRQSARIIAGREFQDTMFGYDRFALKNILRPWLQTAASQKLEIASGHELLDSGARYVRRTTGATTMVLNYVNALQQFTGYFPALNFVRRRSLLRGLAQFYTRPRRTLDFVFEQSPFMKQRVAADMHDAMEELRDMLADKSSLKKVQEFSLRHGYAMQRWTDLMTSTPVWIAAYNEATEAGRSPKDAVRAADKVVRETQSSFNPEDLSAIEIGSPAWRAMLQFFSYFNAQYNAVVTQSAIEVREKGAIGATPALAMKYTNGVLMPAVLAAAISSAFRGGLEDEDDDGMGDDVAWFIITSQAEYIMAGVPIIGSMSRAVMGAFDNKPYNDKVSLTPANMLAESMNRLVKSYRKAWKDGEVTPDVVKNTITTFMMILGIGGGNQIGKAAGYGTGVATGNYQPEDVGDVVRGVSTGRERK